MKMHNENVSMSVRSKGHFLGPWAYAQRVILVVHFNPFPFASKSYTNKSDLEKGYLIIVEDTN